MIQIILIQSIRNYRTSAHHSFYAKENYAALKRFGIVAVFAHDLLG